MRRGDFFGELFHSRSTPQNLTAPGEAVRLPS